MQTKADILAKLDKKLFASGNSSYFDSTSLGSAIDDAYIYIASLHPWPPVEKGFITHTILGDEYIDYPANAQSKSIFKIEIDGDSEYKKTSFNDFLKYKEENPSGTDKLFAEFDRKIFIFPTMATTGVDNLILWGYIEAGVLGTNEASMFSYWAAVLNEAVYLKAFSDCLENIDDNLSKTALTKSKMIVEQEWSKITRRQQREKPKDKPQFEVTDFYRT